MRASPTQPHTTSLNPSPPAHSAPLPTTNNQPREVPADDPEAALPLHGPNQWPSEALLPGFRAAVIAYFDALTALGHKLLRLLALALKLPGRRVCMFFALPAHTWQQPRLRWLLWLSSQQQLSTCSSP